MKQLLLILACMSLLPLCKAQLKAKSKCPAFEVDIMAGRVNGMKPDVSNGELKTKFPCATSSEDEGSASKCGGNVFYKDRDIYFFTGRDYVEIKEKFQGKMSVPLFGTKRGGLFKLLGHPKLKDDNWDAFQIGYGTLILYYNTAGKVNKIQFSTLTTEQINLCD